MADLLSIRSESNLGDSIYQDNILFWRLTATYLLVRFGCTLERAVEI